MNDVVLQHKNDRTENLINESKFVPQLQFIFWQKTKKTQPQHLKIDLMQIIAFLCYNVNAHKPIFIVRQTLMHNALSQMIRMIEDFVWGKEFKITRQNEFN